MKAQSVCSTSSWYSIVTRGLMPWAAGVLLLLLQSERCPAQTRVSRAMEERPPFADKVLDDILHRILVHMDAFHADSAMHWISLGMQHINGHEAPEERYYLLSYRAEVLYYEGLFTEGMQDLDECLPLAERLGDSLLIANVHNLRGLLHENIQESRDALPYMRLALRWFPGTPRARYPVTELHHIHGNLGSYLMNLGMLDSAGRHLSRSLALAQGVGAGRATAVGWWSLGKLALKQAMPDSALACFERCIGISREYADHDIHLDGQVGMAQALVVKGMTKEAHAMLARATQHSMEHTNGIGLVTLRNFARERSKALRSMGDHSGALEAIAEWHRMDSTITTGNTQAALRIQSELLRSDASLELARIERERIAEDLEQVRTSRALLALASGLGLLVVMGLYIGYRSRQRAKQRLAELELLRLQQEQTIAELRIREEVGRDMHDDLGAGLSALKLRSEMALRKEQDPEKRQLLGNLATTAGELIVNMRQIIWTMNADQGTLADLVVYIGNYARTYLDDNGIRFELVVPDTIPDVLLSAQQRRNMLLVVKEALHNVVKHANASEVLIAMSTVDGLTISIEDNGNGLPRNADLGVGNGLRNIGRRMEVLGGTFRVEHGSADGAMTSLSGTRLRFHLPLVTNKGSIARRAQAVPTSSR